MKILVRGTNWIGDAVMSVPALRMLRQLFPDDHITLHTRAYAEGLFRDASFIDEIVTYDPHRWKIKDALDNSEFLRDDGFELAVILPNSFESALTPFLTRIPRRIGYNKDLRGLLLTDPVAVPEWKGRRHEVYYYLNLIAELSRRVLGRPVEEPVAPDVSIEISDARRQTARELLSSQSSNFRSPTLAMAVGSANSPEKRWPPENFAKVADQLASGLGANCVLVGSKDDSRIAVNVMSCAETRHTDLTGKTDLDEAVALLSVVDLLISNDAGLAHVSAAVGTPTLTIFGPTNPEITRPLGKTAVVVQGSSKGAWPGIEKVLQAAQDLLTQ